MKTPEEKGAAASQPNHVAPVPCPCGGVGAPRSDCPSCGLSQFRCARCGARVYPPLECRTKWDCGCHDAARVEDAQ